MGQGSQCQKQGFRGNPGYNSSGARQRFLRDVMKFAVRPNTQPNSPVILPRSTYRNTSSFRRMRLRKQRFFVMGRKPQVDIPPGTAPKSKSARKKFTYTRAKVIPKSNAALRRVALAEIAILGYRKRWNSLPAGFPGPIREKGQTYRSAVGSAGRSA